MLLQLLDHAALLELVDLDHRGEQLEVVAGVRRELLQRERVLREARASVADAGTQEVRGESWAQGDPPRYPDDVRADGLADVRNLVDERDTRHQESIRCKLDHLRRSD